MITLKILKFNAFTIFLAVFLLFVAGEVSATTYYVSPSGSDSNSGIQSQPFRNIQKAVNIVNPGDTVIVKDGIYTDTDGNDKVVYVTCSGTSSNWITFKAENKWGAIIDGQNNATHFGFFIGKNANYIRLEGFEIRDTVNAVYDNYRTTGLYIKNCYIHDIGRVRFNGLNGREAIYVGVYCKDITFDSNKFHTIGRLNPSDGEDVSLCTTPSNYIYDEHSYPNLSVCWNHDHAIYTHMYITNLTIINNIFYDLDAGWCVTLSGSQSNVKIINNTFDSKNPGRTGNHILSHGGTTGLIIKNNIFINPNTAPIKIHDSCSGEISENLIYPNVPMFDPNPQYATYTGDGMVIGYNIFNQDPLVTDLANHNYHLQQNSMAIDSGSSANAPSYDIDGNDRPQGSGYDIGAYEYGGTPPPPDTEDPTVPTGFQAQTISSSQINLSWNASTDNVGVTNYRIYRDDFTVGNHIDEIGANTSYSDTGLVEGTSYTYKVSAVDVAGNESGQSTASQATTIGDTTPPTITSASGGTPNYTKVTVIFSEDIEQSSAETVANYTINQGVNVSSASLGVDLQTVTLATSSLSKGITYTLTVNNVKDRAAIPNTIVPNSQKTFTFTSDLVAYWNLDESTGQNINDSSGNNNGNLGTNNNAEGSDPARVTGKFNNGLQFDGTDDLATISNDSTLNNLSSFTYEAWIYPTGFGGNGYGRIISKNTVSESDIFFLVNGPNGNTLGVSVYNTAGTGFNTYANNNSITLNIWQHVAVAYDESGDRKLHLYHNGQEVAYNNQGTVTGTLKLTTNPIIVGNNASGNRSFQGIIDEVKIYNRALSETEIQNDFNSQPLHVDQDAPAIPSGFSIVNL